jgi:prepilin-type N-terminal cleavage/methylation domain-containing protein
MKWLGRGFTIIELTVVVVVIGILAAIVTVSYNGIQQRARDAQLSDAADKIKDAVQLFTVNKGHFPAGGSSSTSAIGSGTECIDGSNGFVASGNYTCSIEDSLKASGYLPSGFVSKLPANKVYSSSSYNQAVMVYVANASTRLAMVFYSMENPASSDTTHFNAELTKCGYNPGGTVIQRDTYGMRNGTCFNY